jgi:hypothetical protein
MNGSMYLSDEEAEDADRIEPVLSAVGTYWQQHPDRTLADVICSLHNSVCIRDSIVIPPERFEDDVLLHALQTSGIDVWSHFDKHDVE